MNGTYVVEKEFDYTDYANQTIHIDKGVLLRYETYCDSPVKFTNSKIIVDDIDHLFCYRLDTISAGSEVRV